MDMKDWLAQMKDMRDWIQVKDNDFIKEEMLSNRYQSQNQLLPMQTDDQHEGYGTIDTDEVSDSGVHDLQDSHDNSTNSDTENADPLIKPEQKDEPKEVEKLPLEMLE